MAATILICDDDPEIRSAMKRTLRAYQVTETCSPREAMDVLKTATFDGVISDFSLGAEQDGLDLLQHIRVFYPSMVRFLVTGNQELDVAVRAVNEGAVHRYFQKPWDDEKLRIALEIVLHSRKASAE